MSETLVTSKSAPNGADTRKRAPRKRLPNVAVKSTYRGALVLAGAPGELTPGQEVTVRFRVGHFGEPFTNKRDGDQVYAYPDFATVELVSVK